MESPSWSRRREANAARAVDASFPFPNPFWFEIQMALLRLVVIEPFTADLLERHFKILSIYVIC